MIKQNLYILILLLLNILIINAEVTVKKYNIGGEPEANEDDEENDKNLFPHNKEAQEKANNPPPLPDSQCVEYVHQYYSSGTTLRNFQYIGDNYLLGAFHNNTVLEWSTYLNKETRYLDLVQQHALQQFAYVNNKLILAFSDGSIQMIDYDSQRVLWQVKAHNKRISGIIVSDDEQSFVTYAQENIIKRWTIKGELMGEFVNRRINRKIDHMHKYVKAGLDKDYQFDKVTSVLVLEDENILISGGIYSQLIVWDMTTYKMKKIFRMGKSIMQSLAKHMFYSDVLFIGLGNGEIKLLNYKTGEFLGKFADHTSDVVQLLTGVLGEEGGEQIDYLMSSSSDGLINIYDIEKGKLYDTLTLHYRGINGIIQMDDQKFASASRDGTMKIWKYVCPKQQQKSIGTTTQQNNTTTQKTLEEQQDKEQKEDL